MRTTSIALRIRPVRVGLAVSLLLLLWALEATGPLRDVLLTH